MSILDEKSKISPTFTTKIINISLKNPADTTSSQDSKTTDCKYFVAFTPPCNKDSYATAVLQTCFNLQEAQKFLSDLLGMKDIEKYEMGYCAKCISTMKDDLKSNDVPFDKVPSDEELKFSSPEEWEPSDDRDDHDEDCVELYNSFELDSFPEYERYTFKLTAEAIENKCGIQLLHQECFCRIPIFWILKVPNTMSRGDIIKKILPN